MINMKKEQLKVTTVFMESLQSKTCEDYEMMKIWDACAVNKELKKCVFRRFSDKKQFLLDFIQTPEKKIYCDSYAYELNAAGVPEDWEGTVIEWRSKKTDEHFKTFKPKDWKGTVEEWREIVNLEYVLSQGYAEEGDEEKYWKLHKKGWFGED